MKKLLIVILCCFFLAACSDEIEFEGNTPEEAVKMMEQGFAENIKEIQFAEIDNERQIAIFEATTIEGGQEYFASILEKRKNDWKVIEAFNVGNPETTESVQSAGEYLEAGFVHLSDHSSRQYVFELTDSDKEIWVNVFD